MKLRTAFGFIVFALVLVVALLLVAPRPATAWPVQVTNLATAGTTDNTTTAGVKLHKYASSIVLRLPTLTSTYVKVQGSTDNTTYQDLYFPAGATLSSGAQTVWKSPTGTGAIDVPLPPEAANYTYLKVICNDNQAATRTFKLIQK